MQITPHARMLGYAGLLPFITLPIIGFLGLHDTDAVVKIFIQYSAVILAFLGGIHWYDALHRTAKKMQLSVAMLPSLLAWCCLLMPALDSAIVLLIAGFVGMLFYDLQTLKIDRAYKNLRIQLTTVTVLGHSAMLLMN
ncbi:MAG: DUF3429 domain-containing protein [Paraglaciecola sp.]|nr:DUF3429 domain-containing protein [Paraglaciecola sp.]NCT46570.1 DUF3429 domain-containing protein [Paraglaciecola sp.]